MRLFVPRGLVPVAALLFGLMSTGCGDKPVPQAPVAKSLQALSVFFGRYIQTHRGMTPPNEAEFKKFIKGLSAEELASHEVTVGGIDELFVSPRDKKAYGFAFGLKGVAPGANGEMPTVIWETEGVNGKRMISDAVGKITEVDEAEFQRRVPAKK